MADEKQIALAKNVYNTLCAAIDRREWKYEKSEEELSVLFLVSGDDLAMQFSMKVDVDRQIISLISPLPFSFNKEKRIQGAVATCVATYKLADGSFDYDLTDGTTFFRMTASFRESLIGEGLFHYMISYSCFIVDKYNDKFLAINKGLLSIEDFITGKNDE